jgi:RNAse (barnase) inhibitor barstar
MDTDRLLRPDGPWLRLFVADASEAYDRARALERAGAGRVAARVLRGRKMRTFERLYDEVAAALQFPPYFGENLDALDECLTDLEWLPADAYVLVILDAARVLEQDAPEAVPALRELLEHAAREWGRPAGSEWPRPAKPFRVVLQCLPEDADFVRSVWPSAADVPPA